MYEFGGKRVTIMSCSSCNIKCKHCYVSYKGNLHESELYEMCKALKEKYTVNINGTEILLQKGYLNSISLVKQHRILTNGIILNKKPQILEEIKNSEINMIAMSYHFKIHQDVSDVEEKTIKENIRLIQSAGINVELMCTITKQNFDKIKEICESVISLGVHKVRFINYLKTGNALSMEDECILNKSQKKQFFKQLKEIRERYNKDKLLIKRCGTFGRDETNQNCNFLCSAGYDEVVIAPDMKVYPCIFLVKPGYEIGKFENGKVMILKNITHSRQKCLANDIYNSKQRFKI